MGLRLAGGAAAGFCINAEDWRGGVPVPWVELVQQPDGVA